MSPRDKDIWDAPFDMLDKAMEGFDKTFDGFDKMMDKIDLDTIVTKVDKKFTRSKAKTRRAARLWILVVAVPIVVAVIAAMIILMGEISNVDSELKPVAPIEETKPSGDFKKL